MIFKTAPVLALSDAEHLGAAYRAHTLSRRLTILHGNGFCVLHVPFGTTFNTIRLHTTPPPFFDDVTINYPIPVVNSLMVFIPHSLR